MGQDDCLRFLKKQKEPIPAIKISKTLNISMCNIGRALMRLHEQGYIKVERKHREGFHAPVNHYSINWRKAHK
jgi:predicted ArsR family transcriptional regulator